jgi:hypothetical protein
MQRRLMVALLASAAIGGGNVQPASPIGEQGNPPRVTLFGSLK